MSHCLIVFAVMLVNLSGCGPKTPNSLPSGDNESHSHDLAATSTIQPRDSHEGDKTAVKTVATSTLGRERPNGPRKSMRQEKHHEYTQHILRMPAGAQNPTPLTRTHTVAQRTDPLTSQLKTRSLEGKTVTIETKGEQYRFTADGQPINTADTIDRESEFRDRNPSDIDDIIPKTPVRIGEAWIVDPPVGQKIFGPIGPGIDKTSNQSDCKLTRVYTKDGKHYGVMSFEIDFGREKKALSPRKPGGTGSVKVNNTRDVMIDGSSSEGTMTGTIQDPGNASEQGTAVTLTIHGTTEKKNGPPSPVMQPIPAEIRVRRDGDFSPQEFTYATSV